MKIAFRNFSLDSSKSVEEYLTDGIRQEVKLKEHLTKYFIDILKEMTFKEAGLFLYSVRNNMKAMESVLYRISEKAKLPCERAQASIFHSMRSIDPDERDAVFLIITNKFHELLDNMILDEKGLPTIKKEDK